MAILLRAAVASVPQEPQLASGASADLRRLIQVPTALQAMLPLLTAPAAAADRVRSCQASALLPHAQGLGIDALLASSAGCEEGGMRVLSAHGASVFDVVALKDEMLVR
jgi:hypothetical protein